VTFLRFSAWSVLLVGLFLMLSTISPAGFLLILAGAPLVFAVETARALRRRDRRGDPEGDDG
jgi:hypothetical protein